MTEHNFKPNQNYIRIGTDDVFTGQQASDLAELAAMVGPDILAFLLLSLMPTDRPATNPNTKYGIS